MNWLDKVGQMFGGGQQQPQQIDNPYQNQMALQNAQMQKQRAMQMQDAQYQGGGAVGILAGLAQILKGKSLDRKADESITQALGRQFEFDNQRAMKEAEQRAAEDEKRWQRELKKIEEQERLRAQYRQPQGPTRVGNSLVKVGPDGQAQVLYTDPQRAPQNQRTEMEARMALADQLGMTPEQKQAILLGGAQGQMKPPAGYQFAGDGTLAPIKGGPADQDVKLAGQRERHKNEYLKKMTPFKDAESSFNRLESLLDEYGTEQMPFSESKAKLKTAYTNARDNIRVLAATGVLNVGELPFLEEKLADPTAWTSLSAGAIKAQLGEIGEYLKQKKRGLAEQYEVDIQDAGGAPAAPANFTGYKITRID